MEIIRNMPEAEYRARPERSQSDFKHFLAPTPAHAKYAMDNRKTIAEFGMGSALHSLVLEGKNIHAVEPEADGRTKAGKELKALFAAQNEGKIILTRKEGDAVEGMAAGIRRNAGCMALLESLIEREVSTFWDGMKARLDGVSPLGVVDLKSTRGADLWNFSKSILEFGYHIQAAMYSEAASKAGFPCEDFYIIAVENTQPHEAALYIIDHAAIEIGRHELSRLKSLYYKCLESGQYPGYSQDITPISLPNWKIREFFQNEF